MEFNLWPDSLQGSRLVEGRYREDGWKVSSVWRCKECSWIQRVVCEQSRRLALNGWQGLRPKGSLRPQPLHVLQHPAGDAISSAKLDRLTPRPDLAIHSATVDNISIYAEHDSISSAVHTFAGDKGVGDKHLRSLSGPIQISARELSTTWVRRKFLLKE